MGAAVAQLFAQQGAHVVIGDIQIEAARSVATSIQESGGTATALAFDVADEAQVTATMQMIASTLGRLDILVNNAGVSHVGNLLETRVEDWDRVMRVNARGIFLCAREGVRQMLAQEPSRGVIINMASVAGTIAVDRRVSYSASKGAVLALTRSISIDYATQGIRCNALCPGTVHTPFVEGFLARNFAGHEDEERQKLHARQPIGHMGRPERHFVRDFLFSSLHLPLHPALSSLRVKK